MKDTCDRHTKEIEDSGGAPNVGRDIRTCNGCLAATIKWWMEKRDDLSMEVESEEDEKRFKKLALEVNKIHEHIETLTNSLLNHLIKGE